MSVLGFDLSSWNGRVNFNMAYNVGIRFAFIRATSGISYIDPQLRDNIVGTNRSPIHRGFYHVFQPDHSGTEQAEFFLRHVPVNYRLPLVADVEINGSITTHEFRRGLYEFLLYIEAHTSKAPLIYTRKNFWDDHLDGTKWANRYGLWVANYTDADLPHIPRDWYRHDFWQYTETADGNRYGVESENVDLNRFNGSIADFNYFIHRINSDVNLPRTEYVKWTKVVPASADEEQIKAVIDDARRRRQAFTFSYDDPRSGIVELYVRESERQLFSNWFARHYPQVKVVFSDLPST